MKVVARTREDILKARGVKPTLSPNLNVLATVEALDVKRLLFIGVGCQVCETRLTAVQLACSPCPMSPSTVEKYKDQCLLVQITSAAMHGMS